MTYRKRILLISCAVLVQILPTRAQDDSGAILARAYDSLKSGDYATAKRIAEAYLASYPPNYSIEFIHAVSFCHTSGGSNAAQRELLALEVNYDLSNSAMGQVKSQLSSCRPATQASASNGGSAGVIGQGLTGAPPGVDSAAPAQTQPLRFRPMGALVSATSYSGDDYYHYSARSPQACSRTCQIQAPCRSMTYDTVAHICWLKRSVPPAQHGDNYVSAVKLGG